MKALIKLTSADGPLYVNPEYIATISGYYTGSALFIGHDNKATIVRESPETIIEAIKSAYAE